MILYANDIKIPFSETLSLRVYNPLFNDIGSHSFPLSFNALDPQVRKAFGFASIEEVSCSDLIPGRIVMDIIDMRGSWQITDASNNRIEAFFKAGSGDFYSSVGDLLLTSVDFGGIKYPVGVYPTAEVLFSHMDDKMNAWFPQDEYATFCAYTPNAEGENTIADKQVVNEIQTDFGTAPELKRKPNGNDTVYLFTGAVIEYIFKMFGYKIVTNVFREQYDLQRHVIFNAFNRRGHSGFDYSRLLPKVKVVDFLEAVRNQLNIMFVIKENIKEVSIIWFDTAITSDPIKLRNKGISQSFDRRRTTGFLFGVNHPDDFSNNDFSGLSDFNDDVIIVDMARDIVPSILTKDEIYFVTNESAYYHIIEVDGDYEAERLTPDLVPYTVGSGATPIDQVAGLPAMGTWSRIYAEVPDPDPEPPNIPESLETEVLYIMPRYDGEVGNSTKPYVPFPLMFCVARGIQPAYVVPNANPAVTVEHYPLGSYDVINALAEKISTANLALKWSGPYGLIAKMWANRILWEMSIKIATSAEMTNEDLPSLIDHSTVKRIGSNNYLVNTLELECDPAETRIKGSELFRL